MLTFQITGLFVNDMATIVAFYRDVMGMQTDWNGEPNAELRSGKATLILYGRKDFETMTAQPYTYPAGLNGTMELAFDVGTTADVDMEYNRVVTAGAAPVFPPTDEPWGQRTSYVADPDGNLIEIYAFYTQQKL